MGKRKSSRKPMGPKKADPLPTTFTCLFCNHEKSVTVKLDRKAGVGQLDCRVCGQKFQCAVNYLSAAVDVYGEWVDAADAVAKQGAGDAGHGGSDRAPTSRRAVGSKAAADEHDDLEHGAGYDDDDY
ncbi:Transcription elongation factor 1 -like protein [Escovopsis weberi]|uniref:Transcription elongation factor 1 homolog n=1 Tax=Escovopsis weberi TaxID=150374 RepID=A0A0M8N075_ESCWE|nr:Transcription elongation factor 1 -like protein [Escovopsis weberi]